MARSRYQVPPPGGAAGLGEAQLAALSRAFAFNDPQADRGDVGGPPDRNVELLVADPR